MYSRHRGSSISQSQLAEEGGGGKAILLEKGAYEGMAACLMSVLPLLVTSYVHLSQPAYRCHPAPGPKHSAALSSCLARQIVEVEFHGHTSVPLRCPPRSLSVTLTAERMRRYLLGKARMPWTQPCQPITVFPCCVSSCYPLTVSTAFSLAKIGHPTVGYSLKISTVNPSFSC